MYDKELKVFLPNTRNDWFYPDDASHHRQRPTKVVLLLHCVTANVLYIFFNRKFQFTLIVFLFFMPLFFFYSLSLRFFYREYEGKVLKEHCTSFLCGGDGFSEMDFSSVRFIYHLHPIIRSLHVNEGNPALNF